MHVTVDFPMFVNAFRNMGYENKFSYEALEALFDFLDNCDEETGDSTELDVIGLCCDFTEYRTAVEAAADYGFASELEADDYNSRGDFEDAKESEARDWLDYRTLVISFDSGLIIKNF